MGRYDFRPLRVRHTALSLVEAKRDTGLPSWYNVVRNIPPAEALSRPVLQIPKIRRGRKASKLFKPLPIKYPEDKLRSEFFGDHPWELARPRLIVEDSGNDAKGYDWSKIRQPGKQLDGESVVQRQMWLMKHQSLSKAVAYDQARREFYAHRHLSEIRARIAKEEAQHVGAYFGKGPLEIGMDLEDKTWEKWKQWATLQIENEQSMRSQLMNGQELESEDMSDEEFGDAMAELQAVASSTTATEEPTAPPGNVISDP